MSQRNPYHQPDRSDRRFQAAFWILALLTLTVMLAIVPDYGSSGDELTRYQYGKSTLHFYSGIDVGNHLPDTRMMPDGWYNTYHQPYGALFDMPVTLLIHWFRPDDEYLFRHFFNMLAGFAGLLIAGLIGRELTGKWSGALMTLLLFIATPRYWGECFNNPKDIPFATVALLFVLALFRWLKHLHEPGWKRTLGMAVALALPMCIRPGGLLFIAYFMLISGVAFLADRRLRTLQYVLRIAIIISIGYFACVFWWPAAWINPVMAPFQSFKAQSKFFVTISVLFEGYFTNCKNLPWYYIHKLLLLTLPLIVLAGFGISLFFAIARKREVNRLFLWLLLFFIAFPLISMVLRGSVFYDGIRQFLFIVAFIIVVAAAGLWQLLYLLRTRLARIAGVLAVAVGIALPLKYCIANHPNEYIYYNELAGGVKGAFSNYELDYYYNSIRQAYDWLKLHEGERIRSSKDSLILAADCYQHLISHYNAVGKLPLKIIDANLYSQHKSNWDYAIFITRFLDHEELKNGYFNSPKAIHTIKADGVPICIVLKNDSLRYGYKGHLAMQAGQYTEAEQYWLKAVAWYPGDVELWTDLTLLYLKTNQADKAQWAVDNALKISSVNHNTVHLSWEVAFMKKDIKKAVEILTFATRYYRGTDAPWLRLAAVQLETGDTAAARSSLGKAIPYDGTDILLKAALEQKLYRK